MLDIAGQGKKRKRKNKPKDYKSLTKDKVEIEGRFTFFHDTTDNSMTMSIKADQMGELFLCGQSR